jgi:transposase
MSKIIFKSDYQKQPSLFPISFEALIPEKHPVRVLNTIVDRIDLSEILSTYKGGGTSSYHPRILLKILLYAYLNNQFSSRRIEKAANENVHYIWLSGQNFPDHNTINNFRSSKLKGKIDAIFTQVVAILHDSNIISLKEAFTDGTKMESVANRYTFVWKGSVEKYKEKLEKKIQVVIKEIEKAIEEDKSGVAQDSAPTSTTISSEDLNKKIEELNQKLSQGKTSKRLTKKVEKLGKESLPKLQEYEGHLKEMGERNSYSKTDKDATFMRMKEDHMKNGQLKPAYNLQLSTEKNFITNFSIHQRPGDTATFKAHMQSYKEKYGHYPQVEVADSGYGSLENYEFMDQNGIKSYVKYNWFHKEESKKFKTDITRIENLYYNEQGDCFICPMGQKMLPIGEYVRKSDLGYEYIVTKYQAGNCTRCQLNGACHKQKGNRIIEVNKKLILYKKKSKENLTSKEGKELRGRRCTEVEQTFGQIKWNKGFKRFLLRGLKKVNIEIGLIAIAHNIQKLSTLLNSPNLSAFCDILLTTLSKLCNDIKLKLIIQKNIKTKSTKRLFYLSNNWEVKKAA